MGCTHSSAASVADPKKQSKSVPISEGAHEEKADLKEILKYSVFKFDHFENIYRLPKIFEGVPNFRKVDGFDVFGTGQPTLPGFHAVFDHLKAEGYTGVLWTNMRQEPVLYVEECSFTAREPHNLNENIELVGVSGSVIEDLQAFLKGKIAAHVAESSDSSFKYFRDTYAENPADRKNIENNLEVKDLSNVRTLSDVYTFLGQEYASSGLSISYARLPIVDEKAPLREHFDEIVRSVKDLPERTAVFFNCQMGKGRTTTGMICACLVQDAKRRLAAGELTTPAPEKESKEEPQEFTLVKELLAKLPGGEEARQKLDHITDLCGAMQNLKDCIAYTKQMYDKETEERRQFWRRMSINFIERRLFLVAFALYVYTNVADNFAQSFADWCAAHEDLFAAFAGKLADFNWD